MQVSLHFKVFGSLLPNRMATVKSALRSGWMTSYRKNVSRDSPWNLILNILVISAQTGNQILKTTFTGCGNRKWKFDFIFLDFLLWEITRSSCVALLRDRSVKSIPMVLQDQLELWGVNFFVVWVLKSLDPDVLDNFKNLISVPSSAEWIQCTEYIRLFVFSFLGFESIKLRSSI